MNTSKYSYIATLTVIGRELGLESRELAKFIEHTTPRQLNVWVGERYLAESGRRPHDHIKADYTNKDIRRAIAFGRYQQICGAGIGKEAAKIRERIREMASWHTDGWVVVIADDIDWIDNPLEIGVDEIIGGVTFAVVPCEVASL